FLANQTLLILASVGHRCAVRSTAALLFVRSPVSVRQRLGDNPVFSLNVSDLPLSPLGSHGCGICQTVRVPLQAVASMHILNY
ncbi:MAG: hypothetical protein ABSG56_10685, partial [Bryobacteraceae bacterium]